MVSDRWVGFGISKLHQFNLIWLRVILPIAEAVLKFRWLLVEIT